MALESKILKLKDHNINIDMLWIKNSEKPKGDNSVGEDSIAKVSEVVGDLAPMVDINGFKFNHYDIMYMEISESGFLPTIKILVSDKTGTFTNKFFPKNKSLLKLYIKSNSPKIKAIRQDYLITGIKGSSNTNVDNDLSAEGRGSQYYITGTLNVPKMTTNDSEVFHDTSFDALYTLSDRTNLGFSTNEIQTNDKMAWLQPLIDHQETIEYITEYAYKDSSSFFISFIDRYYNLSFINIFSMLSQDEDFDVMFSSLINNKSSYTKGQDSSQDEELQQNSLSNFSGFRGGSNYIKAYTNESSQGKILKENPKRKYISSYDTDATYVHADKFVNIFVESFGSVITDEEIGKNDGYIWEGVDYNNTHDNFLFAKTLNVQNLIELKKIKKKVTLAGANLNLLRGMRVPLLIVNEGHQQETNEKMNVEKEETTQKEDPTSININKDDTGYYIIDSIKYIFDPVGNPTNSFSTELLLCKADWGSNIVEENNN